MLALLLAAVFPLSAFIGGAYLIRRGIAGPVSTFACGQARAASPVRSHLDGDEVVYSRLTVEYFTGRSPEWKEIYSSERKTSFRLSGRPVHAETAHFRLSKPQTISGFVPSGNGLLESVESLLEFGGYEKSGPVGVGLRSLIGRNGPFIDKALLDKLALDSKAKKALDRHGGHFLRISQFVVPGGAKICVASRGPDLRGSAEHPLLVTDEPVEGARTDLAERAKLSLLLGTGLIAFSLLASLALFYSL